MKLLLDDERTTKIVYNYTNNPIYLEKDWIIVNNYEQFCEAITTFNKRIFLISFDHDLGTEKSGMDCAKFLVEFCIDNNLQLPNFMSHSMNPNGKDNIISLLTSFNKFQKEIMKETNICI